jgi:hypothetical protein
VKAYTKLPIRVTLRIFSVLIIYRLVNSVIIKFVVTLVCCTESGFIIIINSYLFSVSVLMIYITLCRKIPH